MTGNNIERVAVMVDGGFYLKRYRSLFSRCPDFLAHDFVQAAAIFQKLTNAHIQIRRDERLYRIFYYDCPPFQKKIHNPLSKRFIDFSKSTTAQFRNGFLEQLKKQRKVALRLGAVKDNDTWVIKPARTKDLLAGRIRLEDLSEDDISFDIKQKGVDMRIGLDISALSYKRLVDRIVLIAGDSDFVPAAKVARREGIDFILDPMWNPIGDDLFEHIDGLFSTAPRPKNPISSIEAFLDVKRAAMDDGVVKQLVDADELTPGKEDHA